MYALDVTAPGFDHLTRTGITAVLGESVSVSLVVKPGSDAQTVTINEDAPLLQAVQADIEANIPGKTVNAIPLNSRNFINLAQLAPGVELPPGTVLPRINGGRPRTNEYLFDGISALQPEPGQVAFFPILDDIAGVHRAGRQRAGRVWPLQWRRRQRGHAGYGSNQFHGSASSSSSAMKT